MDDTKLIQPGDGRRIYYDVVQVAMKGEPFTMSITADAEKKALIAAVNIGIDSRLQACNCPDRGDSYGMGERSITATSDTKYWQAGDKLVLAHTLECVVSVESLPVLLRRLFEDAKEEHFEASYSLADSILGVLGFNDSGVFVGRED